MSDLPYRSAQGVEPSGVDAPAHHTQAEIWSQGVSWTAAARVVQANVDDARRFFAGPGSPPLFIGCGSPYHLCESVAAAFEDMTGQVARALPAGELMLSNGAHPAIGRASVVVAVSRSGETSELLAACALLQQGGARIVAVTPTPASSLTRLADWTVTLPDAAEVSLAQTRSFGAMLIAALGLAAVAAGREDLLDDLDRVAALAPTLLTEADRITNQLTRAPFARIVFLGSGPRFGLAREGLVKTVEMSLTDASAYPVLEIRHGPQALVDEATLVVGLLNPDGSAQETAVLRDMHDLGATVVASGGSPMSIDASRFLQLDGHFTAASPAHLVSLLPLIHLTALKQAQRRMVDPDVPRNLSRYVDLAELG